METDLVAPATPTDPTPAAPVDPAAAPSAEPSIAEHEAQFGKQKVGVDLANGDDRTVERPRHRAKSQQASAADVPRIAELTKRLRDAERERDEWKSKHATPPPAPAREPERTPSAAPETPKATGKPSLKTFEDQIGTKYDTYADAVEAYTDARDDWREAQATQKQQESAQQQSHQAVQQTYVDRARAFAKSTPDFGEKTAAAAQAFDAAPQLLQASVITYDNGPEIAYYLATHPDVLDDLSLLTDGKPVTQAYVAMVQRRFSQYRSTAVVTGSAPVVIPRTPAPRPPNPVRTGPMKPTDEPPGDDASIADHERFYGKKRR